MRNTARNPRFEQRVADLEARFRRTFKSFKAAPRPWLPTSKSSPRKSASRTRNWPPLAQLRKSCVRSTRKHWRNRGSSQALLPESGLRRSGGERRGCTGRGGNEGCGGPERIRHENHFGVRRRKNCGTNLETTRQDLAASRRDLVDVKTVLSDRSRKNSSELATLRQKGERDYFEYRPQEGEEKRNAARRGYPSGTARSRCQEAEIRHHHSGRRQQARKEGQARSTSRSSSSLAPNSFVMKSSSTKSKRIGSSDI